MRPIIKMKFPSILFFLCVTVLMTSQVPIQALSMPSLHPLIVIMGGDTPEEKVTLETIQKHHGNIKVVKYNSIEFLIEISRSVGDVFYIGHGSNTGIMYKNREVPYDQLSEIRSPLVFFLSCHSPTFESRKKIDAVEAGIFAAAVIAIQNNQNSLIPALVKDYVTRHKEIISGKSQGYFLGDYILDSPWTSGGLGNEESAYWSLVFLTILILAVIPGLRLLSLSRSDLVIKGVLAFFLAAEMAVFLLNIGLVMKGSVDVITFIANILIFLIKALWGLAIVIPQVLNWFEMILCGTAIIASALAIKASGGLLFFTAATSIVATMMLHATAFLRDLNDTGVKVGYDELVEPDPPGGGSTNYY